jgi:hypothetical protein
MKSDRIIKAIKVMFNPLMIWGAVSGLLIFWGYVGILDAWRHRGPGVLWRGDFEWQEKVSEQEYKRATYVRSVGVLFLGLGLWIWKGKDALKDNPPPPN